MQRLHTHRNTAYDPLFRGFSASVLPATLLTPASMLSVGYLEHNDRLREEGWKSLAAVAVSGGISLGLKLTIRRERPYARYPDVNALVHTGPYSFPSAHSSNAFVTATSLTLAFPKWYVAVPAYSWAGIAAYSRIHMGVHYPGDVAAGMVIGVGSALLTHYLNRWYRNRYLSKN